jgi:hypothetical protein
MTIAPADQTYASALALSQSKALGKAKTAAHAGDPIAKSMASAQEDAKTHTTGPAVAPGKGQVLDVTA